MPEPTSPIQRYRERVQSLRTFSASATGFTAQNAERDPFWIDRVRFHVPVIGIRRTTGDLYTYLKERKGVGPFQFGQTPAGLNMIEFKGSQWLFSTTLSFWRTRSRPTGVRRRAQEHTHPYIGRADITLNPTRLFAHMAPEVVAGAVPALHTLSLEASSDRAGALRGRTLDGSDNVIPDGLIAAAIRLDWPRFCQAYAQRVVECMSRAIGTVYDVGAEQEDGADKFEYLLDLPPPERWSLQQTEFYHEYAVDDAVEAVRRVEPYALSLSREVKVRLYEKRVRAETVRRDNARSLSMSLGRKGAYLVLYAKTLDRVRAEIRYEKTPATIAGLSSTEYAKHPNGMADLLQDISAESAGRLAQWISEFQESIPRGRPTRAQLVVFISTLSAICGTGPLLTRVLNLLLAHGGLIPTGHVDLDRLVPQMVRRRLIVRVRSAQTRNVIHYRLSPHYGAVVRLVRALNEARPAMGTEHFPP
ncbi:hypothetical protein Q8W71_20210 [Methylobacterium sp. NEAU 140]|uniref:hypothetical protein n=1 Tax=Methylobacterium sp. NEAU 140 TaxID=3064945 RepID=UPI00273251E2|nr:hypothetical protein [Methylobacterium sp. NEAU 140]MDP4024956.1 hypothetical protein [Methylobacterium sp. NEAU 140]